MAPALLALGVFSLAPHHLSRAAAIATDNAAAYSGGWSNGHRLCYQSKVGASKWLQPSLHRTLRDLSAEKIEEVCIVPISFVSDHVETLGEIDHEAREEAAGLGIKKFEMTTGLNDSPTFIAALADLVANAAGVELDQACLLAGD